MVKSPIEEIVLNKIQNRTFLITGVTGFIGSYLVESLLELNELYKLDIKILAVARDMNKCYTFFSRYRSNPNLTFIEYTFIDELHIPDKYTIDYVIHLAAPARSSYFKLHPVETFNFITGGTNKVLDFSIKRNIRKFLYCSSCTVYGEFLSQENNHIVETDIGRIDQKNVSNIYASSKRAAEQLCISYKDEYNLSVVIARPAYIYGANPTSNDSSVWSYIISCLLNKKNIELDNSGYIYRSICYVKDVIKAFLYIVTSDSDSLFYNISSDNTSIRNFAEKASSLYPDSKLIFIGKQSFTSKKDFLSNDLLIKNGWTPSYDIETGIIDSINILRRFYE